MLGKRRIEALIIDGVAYPLANDIEGLTPLERNLAAVQPVESGVEASRVIVNLARGWGETQFTEPGGYERADVALMHLPGYYLAGCAPQVVELPLTPQAPITFAEYWNGPQDRAFIVVGGRYVHEMDVLGNWRTASLSIPAGALATKAVTYQSRVMSGPRTFVAVQDPDRQQPFLTRAEPGRYEPTPSGKYAEALGVARDAVGEPVLWRADGQGRLNQCVSDGDPDSAGGWQLDQASTPLGTPHMRINDIYQIGRYVYVGREDGIWTFDAFVNAIRVTAGLEATPARYQCMPMKSWGGMLIAPTQQGLIWVVGTEWGVAGPSTTANIWRIDELRGFDSAASAQAGSWIYAALYNPATDVSWLFLGSASGNDQTPFVWHGPFAKVTGQITDLAVSTVYETRLWIGWSGNSPGVGYIPLGPDMLPADSGRSTSGYIYLPDGLLDLGEPGVLKDIRKVELHAPSTAPFGSANDWRVEFWADGSWVGPIATVDKGTLRELYYDVRTYRGKARLRYESDGSAPAVLSGGQVRAVMRPEMAWVWTARLRSRDNARLPSGVTSAETRETMLKRLRELAEAPRVVSVVAGDASFMAHVTGVREVGDVDRISAFEGIVEVRLKEVSGG